MIDQAFIEQMRQCVKTRFDRERVRAPRIKAMADFIRKQWPSLYVELQPWTSNTDRESKSGRWRIPGKGRKGKMLTVSENLQENMCGHHLLKHETGGTYRHNYEVAEWIIKRLDGEQHTK